jgi:hypothetical protein
MFVYIEILFRYWRRFLVLLLLLPLTIGVVTVVFFPTYKATSQLWVENFADVGLGTPSGWNTYLTPSQNLSDSLTQLLNTRAFNDSLYDRVVQGGFTTRAQRDDVGASIAGIAVAAPGTHLLAITAGCDQRDVCVAVLGGLIDLFREQQVKLEQNQATVAITFFTEQLKTAKPARDAAQDLVSSYVEKHPSLKIDPNATLNDFEYARLVTDLRDKQSRVDDLNNRLAHDQFIASASQDVLQIGPQVVDAPVIARGGLLGDGTSLRRAMFSAVGCYAIAGLYLFLLVFVDKTARDPREIERRLKVPVVATIPRLSAGGVR